MKKKFLDSSVGLVRARGIYSEEQLEIIAYGLEGLYITITKLVVILLLAFLLNILGEVITLLATYNIIRSQAFGIHASKSSYCLITSIIMLLGGALLCKYLTINFGIKLAVSIICNICLYLFAPADTQKRPLINPRKRKKFKFVSTVLGLIYTILIAFFANDIISNYLLIGMIEAVIMILPITYKIFKMPYNNYKHYDYDV